MNFSDLFNFLGDKAVNLPNLQLKLSRFSYFQANCDEWRAVRDFKKFKNTIYYVLDGDAIVAQGGREWRLEPGRVYLIPCKADHRQRCETFISKYYGLFSIEVFPGRDLLDSLEQPVIDLGEWNHMEMEFFNKAESQEFTLQNYAFLTGLLMCRLQNMKPTLQELMEEQSKVQLKYGELLRLIDMQLASDLKVIDLAKAMGRSAPSLSRAFSRDFGITLKDYLVSSLNRKICEALSSTDMTSKEIATKYHFADAAYFNHFFKKQNGMTPKQYRRTALL